MSPERLKELKGLCDAATEGPWEYTGVTAWTPEIVAGDICIPVSDKAESFLAEYSHRMDKENAQFIAAARTALPELVEEVERLEELKDLFVEMQSRSNERMCELNTEVKLLRQELAKYMTSRNNEITANRQ